MAVIYVEVFVGPQRFPIERVSTLSFERELLYLSKEIRIGGDLRPKVSGNLEAPRGGFFGYTYTGISSCSVKKLRYEIYGKSETLR